MNLQKTRRDLIVLSNTLSHFRASAELIKAGERLTLASMWCGKAMHALGSENPYEKFNGDVKTWKGIAETFDDTKETLDDDIIDEGIIYTLHQMRDYLKKTVEASFEFFKEEDDILVKQPILAVSQYMIEASMYFGRELKRIRELGEDAPEVRL